MKYLNRYILIALFISAIPCIIYESVKFYNKKEYGKFIDWLVANGEYHWHCLKHGIIN